MLQVPIDELALLLDYYKKPSSASNAAVQTGKTNIGDKQYSLNGKLEIEFVLRLAAVIGVDEIETFRLLRSYIRAETSAHHGSLSVEYYLYSMTTSWLRR